MAVLEILWIDDDKATLSFAVDLLTNIEPEANVVCASDLSEFRRALSAGGLFGFLVRFCRFLLVAANLMHRVANRRGRLRCRPLGSSMRARST